MCRAALQPGCSAKRAGSHYPTGSVIAGFFFVHGDSEGKGLSPLGSAVLECADFADMYRS
ncbi:hypothetical protein EDP1_3118 [Pseudomonas putida S610]|nr:hypothetical protein EDP1_3118 [Pseudomonas putida S610]